eukprot:scaffold27238_cov31-Tisochrysis_lutea.AAC.3
MSLNLGGVCAATANCDNTVAYSEPCRSRSLAHFADLASRLIARYKWWIRLLLVLAAALQDLGKVNASGGHAHTHLRREPGCGRRCAENGGLCALRRGEARRRRGWASRVQGLAPPAPAGAEAAASRSGRQALRRSPCTPPRALRSRAQRARARGRGPEWLGAPDGAAPSSRERRRYS